jgi:hypothetical protein
MTTVHAFEEVLILQLPMPKIRLAQCSAIAQQETLPSPHSLETNVERLEDSVMMLAYSRKDRGSADANLSNFRPPITKLLQRQGTYVVI